jgi:transmembrane 9 superfamily protein 2/4
MEIVNFLWIKFFKEMNFSRVHGDVFRAPQGRMLLSVLIGNGVQITIMSLITLGKVLFLNFY